MDQCNDEVHKKALTDKVVKNIKTTMIGSISIIEDAFSRASKGEQVSFQDIRGKILDLGNREMNIAKNTIDIYEIKLPVFFYRIKIGKGKLDDTQSS